MADMKLIRGGIVLSMVDGDPPREADLLIEGDRILAIGSEEEVSRLGGGATRIDARNCLVMPGLINSHTHTPMTMMRSTSDDVGAPDPSRPATLPPNRDWRGNLTRDDIYWSSCLAIAEMIRCGTTSFVDMYHDMDQVARAVVDAGVRAALGWEIISFRTDVKEWLPYDEETARQSFEASGRFVSDWNGKADGRLQALVAPHETSTCHEPWLTRSAELAEQLGVGITMHLAESLREVDYCRKHHGATPVEVAEGAGILDHHVIGAHSIHLTQHDIAVLAEADFVAAACLGSYLKLADKPTPVPDLVKAGVDVAIGTDSAETNNNLSVWEEVYLNATLHAFLAMDASLVPANVALRMATVGGARALGLESELGTLVQGKKADITIVDLNGPHLHPLEGALIGNLVYAGSGHDVRDVLVDGRFLMRERQLMTIDEHAVIREVSARVRRLRGEVGLPSSYSTT